jgi:hypothetical protein
VTSVEVSERAERAYHKNAMFSQGRKSEVIEETVSYESLMDL